jgi:hypothetical protein
MKNYIVLMFLSISTISANLFAQQCYPVYTGAVNSKITAPVPDECFKGNYWTSGQCVSTGRQNHTAYDLTGCADNWVQEVDQAIYYKLSTFVNDKGKTQNYCNQEIETSNTDTQVNVNKPKNFTCPKQP